MEQENKNATRWRLILGEDTRALEGVSLSEKETMMDEALATIYNGEGEGSHGGKKGAGLGASAPKLAKWLTDVRTFFPELLKKIN